LRTYVVVLVIAAALSLRSAWAESAAHSGGENTTAHPQASSDAKGKTIAPKSRADAPAKQNIPGAEVNSGPPENAARTPQIDTRIGVPDGRARRGPPVPDRRIIGVTPSSVKPHELRPTSPLDHTARNAIGVSMPTYLPHMGMAPGQATVQPPAVHHPIVAPITTSHPVIANAPHQTIPPVVHSPPPPNGAVVSGTGMARPGTGPATIGGAAKKVTGINGTTIRPKQ
jgi:hypothetical protein